MAYGLCSDFPLFREVAFVAEDYYDCLLFAVILAKIDPFVQTTKGAFVLMVREVLVRSKTTKATNASLR
jgi:hypothetical protein